MMADDSNHILSRAIRDSKVCNEAPCRDTAFATNRAFRLNRASLIGTLRHDRRSSYCSELNLRIAETARERVWSLIGGYCRDYAGIAAQRIDLQPVSTQGVKWRSGRDSNPR